MPLMRVPSVPHTQVTVSKNSDLRGVPVRSVDWAGRFGSSASAKCCGRRGHAQASQALDPSEWEATSSPSP